MIGLELLEPPEPPEPPEPLELLLLDPQAASNATVNTAIPASMHLRNMAISLSSALPAVIATAIGCNRLQRPRYSAARENVNPAMVRT